VAVAVEKDNTPEVESSKKENKENIFFNA